MIKCFLCERNGLCFAFDDEQGLHLPVIDDGVTTFGRFAHRDGLLNGNERSREIKLLHQTVKQLLTYPFLRREAHPAVPPVAEDLFLIIIYARTQVR